jgi:hypothetical protein
MQCVFLVAKFCNLVICFQKMKIWKKNSNYWDFSTFFEIKIN